MSDAKNPLPSWTELVEGAGLKKLAERVRQQPVVGRLRGFLDEVRGEIRSAAQKGMPEVASLAVRLARTILPIQRAAPRTIINATGVLTPFQYAVPLADAAVEQLAAIAGGYATASETSSCLPSSPDVERVLTQLTGAEAAIVLRSPEAALVGIVSTLAKGRDVVVARSHISKVDNSYLLADLIGDAGGTLREVGAANGQSAADYREAIGPRTALVLRSSASAQSTADAAENVPLDELAQLAQAERVTVVEYLPVATLVDLAQFGGPSLPLVGQSIVSGADLVVFSSACCLGGPACGIIVGRRSLVERIANHRQTSALAVDILALAALKATLALYRDPPGAQRSIPLLQLLTTTPDNLRHRAQRLAPQLEECAAVGRAEVVSGSGFVTAVRRPGEELSSWCLAIAPAQGTSRQLADSLRSAQPPVEALVADDRLVLNLRSVLAREDEQIVAAFRALGLKSAESLTGRPETTAADSTQSSSL